jgi:hypothetical protein
MQRQEHFGSEKKQAPVAAAAAAVVVVAAVAAVVAAAAAAAADGHGLLSAAAAACFSDTLPQMGQEVPYSTGLMCVPQRSSRVPVGRETPQADQNEREGCSSQTLE